MKIPMVQNHRICSLWIMLSCMRLCCVIIMNIQRIRINDLFSLMDAHRLDGICVDKIHLNETGIELCAAQVVREIRAVL